jgi:primase-polymerase (primpol)-like protein
MHRNRVDNQIMSRTRTEGKGGDTIPPTVAVNPDGIPGELRGRPQWVLWRWALRDGKYTKPPFQADGTPAKSNDPTTWTAFAAALEAYRGGDWGGVGYCFRDDDDVFAIDLDQGRDPAPGVIQGWAVDVVREMATYTEISPSGTGLRIVGSGVKPGRREKQGPVEIYDRASTRFLTFTGHHLDGTPLPWRPARTN